MAGHPEPPSLDELGKKLEKAKKKHNPPEASAVNMAVRLGSEFVSGVLVVDDWLLRVTD